MNVRNDLRSASPFPQAWLILFASSQMPSVTLLLLQISINKQTPKSLPNIFQSFWFSSSSDLSLPYLFSAPTFQHRIFRHALHTWVVFTHIQLLVSAYFQAGLSFLSLLCELSIFSPYSSYAKQKTSTWTENSEPSFLTSGTVLRTPELQHQVSSIQPQPMAPPITSKPLENITGNIKHCELCEKCNILFKGLGTESFE